MNNMTDKYINDVLERVSSGIVLYEYTGDTLSMLYCNNMACRMLGYKREAFAEKCAEDAFFCVFADDIQKLSESIRMSIEGSSNNEREVRFVKKDRSVIWVKCSSNVLDSDDTAKRIVVTLTDVTEEIITKEELSFRANHDELTSIFNANAFYNKTREMLNENPDKSFTLVRINIVKFKVVNDLFGTRIADSILISAARFIEKVLEGRTAAYGRITSDHFAFCLETSDFSEQELIDEMQRFADSFPDYYNLSFKAGIYNITDRAISIAVMCDRAKLAMQTIKNDLTTVFAYYNDDIRKNLLMEQRIESEMQWALDNEQFEVWFQPIYSLSSMKPYSAEALVRWRHPTKGLISPGLFIPVFEKNGFIRKLDRYVFEHVCAYLRERLDSKQYLLPISVNVSRMSLYAEDLAQEIIGIVERYGLTPDLFKIEITETAYNNYPQILLNTINKLRAYGFTILMDDFGSGYSSLNTLKDLPIDVLKIDMNFMADFNASDKATNILASIIRMAKWLDMPCIAEGVETESQVDFLKSIGCDNIQGFYFSRPLPRDDFEKVIGDGSSSAAPAAGNTLEASSEDVDAMLSGNQTITKLMNGLFGGIGFYEYNGNNLEVLRVNEGYYRIFGYSLTEYAHDAKNVFGKIHKNDLQPLLDALKTAGDTRKAVHITFRRYNAKGKLLYLDASVSRFGGTDDKQLICIAFNDITDHVMLERKSESYNSQMKAIIANMNDGVGLFSLLEDGSVRTRYVSDNFLKIARLESGEQLTDIVSLADPRDSEALHNAFFTALHEKSKFSERFRIRSFDDSSAEEKWASFSCSMVTDPESSEAMMIAVISDITGKVREEQVRYSDALASVFDRIYRIDMSQSNIELVSSKSGTNDILYERFIDTFGLSDAMAMQRKWLARMCRQAYVNKVHRCEHQVYFSDESKWLELVFLKLTDTDYLMCVMDVSQKKVSETLRLENEKLRLSQQFHESESIYVHQTGVAIIEYDYITNKVTATDNYRDFAASKLIDNPDMLSAGNVDVMAHPDDLPGLIALFTTADNMPPFEARLLRNDGEYVWCQINKTVIRDENGRPLRAGYTILDINQRKLSEEKLREASDRLGNIVGHANSGIALFDIDDNYHTHTLFRNDAFYSILGYDKDSYIEKNIVLTDIINNYDMNRINDALINKISGGKSYTTEVRISCEDGSKRWIKLDFAPYVSSEGVSYNNRIIMITTDITSLKETSLRLSTILDKAGNGISMFEVHGNVLKLVFANPMFLKLNGYASTDEVNDKGGAMELVHPDDKRLLYPLIEKAINEGATVEEDYRVIIKNGEIRWRHVTASPIPNIASEHPLLLAIYTDITEIKNTSERFEAVVNTIPGAAAYYRLRGYKVFSEYYVPNAAKILGFDNETAFEQFKQKVREDARFISPTDKWGDLENRARSLSASGGKIVLHSELNHDGNNIPVILYGLTTPDISDGLPAINLLLIVPPEE